MKRTEAVQAIKKLLVHAVEHGASDIFITVGSPPAMKVDGEIRILGDDAVTLADARQLVTCIMRDRHLKEFDATKECNFAISPGTLGRFRVNAYVQRECPAMVMRRIATEPPSLDALGLPAVLADIAMVKRGLALVVGGTGSGKSTTLAAMIDHRNSHGRGHIITLEDPIEFVHDHKRSLVSQREVGMDTEDWGVALKNTLRQAPDVILLGEVRDRETMDQAVQIAETGHLALATLHANNANQALDRIINFFPEERRDQLLLDLSLNLRAIVSQRLVRKREGEGRVAAIEILLNTPLVSDRIAEGEVEELRTLMDRSREQGMQTFDHALFDLYERGVVAYDVALRNADSTNDLRYRIKLESERFKTEQPERSAPDWQMVEEDAGRVR